MAQNKDNQQFDYDYRETPTSYSDGIAVVGKEGKFGYINRRGVEITPLKYDRAMTFFDGTGRVQLEGKWGVIEKSKRF